MSERPSRSLETNASWSGAIRASTVRDTVATRWAIRCLALAACGPRSQHDVTVELISAVDRKDEAAKKLIVSPEPAQAWLDESAGLGPLRNRCALWRRTSRRSGWPAICSQGDSMNPKELLDLIKHRRVVRRFEPGRAVDEGALRRVLEAAIWAPFSAYAPQQWKFIAARGAERDAVVDIIKNDHTVLKYLRLMYEESGYGGDEDAKRSAAAQEFARSLGGAPVVVVSLVHQDPHGRRMQHNTIAAWCGGENMMLQAQAEGLATGVVSLSSAKVQVQLVEHFGLDPDEWAPAFAMNLGHAAETPEATPRQMEAVEIRG